MVLVLSVARMHQRLILSVHLMRMSVWLLLIHVWMWIRLLWIHRQILPWFNPCLCLNVTNQIWYVDISNVWKQLTKAVLRLIDTAYNKHMDVYLCQVVEFGGHWWESGGARPKNDSTRDQSITRWTFYRTTIIGLVKLWNLPNVPKCKSI